MRGGACICSPPYGGVRGGLLLQPLNRFLVADDFDGVGLSCATWDELEGGVAAEVLEALAHRPAGVDLKDVVGGELLGGDGSLGLEFDVEASEVAEANGVACEKLLAEAVHRVGQNALHGTLGEGRVVVGDVLAEVVEGEAFVNLRGAVGLRLGDLRLLRSGLSAHDANGIVNHFSLILWKLKGS